MRLSRREILRGACGIVSAGMSAGLAPAFQAATPSQRSYHLSISPDALEADPELLRTVRDAGVTDLWITGFLYGHWYYPVEKSVEWRRKIEAQGMATHVIDVPLGHPGDSLGAMSGSVPLTPPRRWKLGVRPDGSRFAGTSLHDPATKENAEAVRRIRAAGFKRIFVDDDFRLAQGPGIIGGCFCSQHKAEFLRRFGYQDRQWDDLLQAVRGRALTRLVRDWIEFTCDDLSACFRSQQAAAPDVSLGIMVMYLGAEKAGIRLKDYRDVPFRVGELMFEDGSFSPLKGKTDELFSALFHRRFAKAELAFSETTAYPANKLSAANMAAKLVVSTISDVRHTMFMSGITAFPRDHWRTLAPAMKRQAEIHRRIAGHVPRGPLKHYWGEAARCVGDDNPHSLFLALGIPFEVTDAPAADGFTFLADADAQAAASGDLRSAGTVFVVRAAGGAKTHGGRVVPESAAELAAFKRDVVAKLDNVPYVDGETPVVCAWYPTARAVLFWNLSERRETLTLRLGDTRRNVAIDALDAALIEGVG